MSSGRRGGVKHRLGLDVARGASGSPSLAVSGGAPSASGQGGIRQRLAAEAVEAQRPDEASGRGVRQRLASQRDIDAQQPRPFKDLVTKKWSSGRISAEDVLELSEAASAQGAR
eukprot:17775-Pyramimonas_sp.AAC.1